MKVEEVIELAHEVGFEYAEKLNMEALVPLEEVREMCSSGKCQRYGTSWSCPPALGDLGIMKNKMASFNSGVIFQTVYPMADSFDMESISQGALLHKKRFDVFSRQMKLLSPDCMPMSAGTCTHCRKCTYPHGPCRFPEKVFPSMEACGLLVNDVCTKSGMKYNYGTKHISFTSCVLF